MKTNCKRVVHIRGNEVSLYVYGKRVALIIEDSQAGRDQIEMTFLRDGYKAVACFVGSAGYNQLAATKVADEPVARYAFTQTDDQIDVSHLSAASRMAISRRSNELRGMSYDEQLSNLLNLED